MKRFVTAFLLIVMSVAAFAKTDKDSDSKNRLFALVGEYKGKEGFEIVQVGSFGTSAIKTLIRASLAGDDSEDTRMMLKAMKGIKKMAVVEYSGCSEAMRGEFNARVENTLESSEPLIDVSDGKDVMKLYGIVNEEKNVINDFVMYSPNDCTLICLFGSIPMDVLETAAKQ